MAALVKLAFCAEHQRTPVMVAMFGRRSSVPGGWWMTSSPTAARSEVAAAGESFKIWVTTAPQ